MDYIDCYTCRYYNEDLMCCDQKDPEAAFDQNCYVNPADAECDGEESL